MEVQSIALNSANVRYNNANDGKRVYDIESNVNIQGQNVNIQGQNVNGFESGVIKKDNVQVATFSMWGTNLNPSFQGLEPTEMCAVLMAINEFISSVKQDVENSVINI